MYEIGLFPRKDETFISSTAKWKWEDVSLGQGFTISRHFIHQTATVFLRHRQDYFHHLDLLGYFWNQKTKTKRNSLWSMTEDCEHLHSGVVHAVLHLLLCIWSGALISLLGVFFLIAAGVFLSFNMAWSCPRQRGRDAVNKTTATTTTTTIACLLALHWDYGADDQTDDISFVIRLIVIYHLVSSFAFLRPCLTELSFRFNVFSLQCSAVSIYGI